MHIAASGLNPHLHPDIEVRVYNADGSPWKVLRGPAVQILVDKQLVSGGVGSRSRLRYVTLNAAPDVAEMELERQERANLIRGRLQHSQASQTCVRDPQVAVRDGRIGTYMTYRHVRGWAFGLGERLRQARADAERRQLATA